jgi:hypothetical protein
MSLVAVQSEMLLVTLVAEKIGHNLGWLMPSINSGIVFMFWQADSVY